MLTLLARLSWPELRHHPWRNLAALVAVMLGVALAYSVHLINASALSEFSAAVRTVNGEPDLRLVGPRTGFDEALYARVAAQPDVALASPVVEGDVTVLTARAKAVSMHVVGIDLLVAGPTAGALVPVPDAGESRYAMLDPGAIFLNRAAEDALARSRHGQVTLQAPAGTARTVRVAGRIAASGPPLAVIDIAGAQLALDSVGRLSRIDVHLAAGADRAALLARLALPAGVRAAAPDEATDRISNVSRAYRVNLTVLALVAMFTGAFLVFSILSLSVAKRQQQLALLGVLGLGARERLQLVLGESAVLGVAGSVLGLLLGAGLAAIALRLFGGDLGGGYFPGVAPRLRLDAVGTLGYGSLGVVAALVGGWLPARTAARLAPAQALKGHGGSRPGRHSLLLGLGLVAVGVALAFLPAIDGLPLAAYVSVACLLVGGIACVPGALGLVLGAVPEPRRPLLLLAVERARHERQSATIAVAGVVASLALSVALTVMVASFRDAVTHWLDVVLPADLYARVPAASAGERATLPPALVHEAGTLPGVRQVQAQRVVPIDIDPTRPAAALIARPIGDPSGSLPLTGDLAAVPAGAVAVYVSEPIVALYGVAPGRTWQLPLPDGRHTPVFVAGVWRDYARQYGAVVIDAADYLRLTGDDHVNDLALWLTPGADLAAIEAALRRQAGAMHLEFASPREIRTLSLRIFDRSFAVTYWLQSVAIGIGLFGIAASFSAQVLARRREFGLLAHLGLTRRQILTVVACEGLVWTAVGAALGLGLGIAVSVVLVDVVNPQSFHWTMAILLPWPRLAALTLGVVAAGSLTAWLAARQAAGAQTVLAVKEDW